MTKNKKKGQSKSRKKWCRELNLELLVATGWSLSDLEKYRLIPGGALFDLGYSVDDFLQHCLTPFLERERAGVSRDEDEYDLIVGELDQMIAGLINVGF